MKDINWRTQHPIEIGSTPHNLFLIHWDPSPDGSMGNYSVATFKPSTGMFTTTLPVGHEDREVHYGRVFRYCIVDRAEGVRVIRQLIAPQSKTMTQEFLHMQNEDGTFSDRIRTVYENGSIGWRYMKSTGDLSIEHPNSKVHTVNEVAYQQWLKDQVEQHA